MSNQPAPWRSIGILALVAAPLVVAGALMRQDADGNAADGVSRFAWIGAVAISAWIAYAFGLFGERRR